MMARVEGIDPDKVEIGQRVKARITSLKWRACNNF
jgi:uncharacterized OB-fold protein